jgi:hypothetical protein
MDRTLNTSHRFSAHPAQRWFWGDEFGPPFKRADFLATVFKGDLVVGGTFTHIGGKAVWFVARWNGTEWLPMADGMDGPVWALLVDGDVLYAGGSFRLAGHEPTDGIGVWNGTSWAAVGDRSLTQEGHFPRSSLTTLKDLIVGDRFNRTNTDVAGVARYHGGNGSP